MSLVNQAKLASSKTDDRKRRQLLVKAKGAHEAFSAIYEYSLLTRRHLSLRKLATKAKIPSSGYLSEVLQGRRLLAKKHAHGLAKALQLEDDEIHYFVLLLDRDRAKDPDKKLNLNREVIAARYRLSLETQQLTQDVQGLFFATEVFAAMSLFGESVSKKQLFSFFGRHRRTEVSDALAFLLNYEIIESLTRESFRTTQPLAHFTTHLGSSFYQEFMKFVLQDSIQKLQRWFGKRDLAVFSTSVVSVDILKYQAKLPEIKQKILEIVSDLEESSADSMVRMNFQMFPLSNQ